MKKIFFSLIYFCLSSMVIAQNAQYIDPMTIKPLLSASYAELRANHFHAGIDITTSGATGVPVRAVADGYVSRIKVSPYGYGYALYITHNDGYTTVYGHLSVYAEKIDSVIVAEQYRQKAFEVDYFPKVDAIPVKCGEVVAFSGNSGGSGGPHLHFEVRDTETEEPLNPLAFLPTITDTQAPTIYGAKLYIATDDAQIAGSCNDKYYSLSEISNKTIEAFGNIKFGIHAVDYFIAGHRPCGVVEISLFDNGKLIYKSHIDRFSFDETRFINSHIDFKDYKSNKRFIQKSFVEPNNQLRIYKAHNEFRVAEGETHKMRYELKDFVGNKSVLNFNIVGKKNSEAKARKHNGYKVEWNKTWALDTMNISVVIPNSSLYTDEYIKISKNDSKLLAQPVYTIGNEGIPLQKNASITLPLPTRIANLLKKNLLKRQVFVAQVSNKNQLSYIGGVCDGSNIKVSTRNLGNFAISVDTIAPKVYSKNTRTNLVQKNSVMIGLTDDMSGIAKYNCYIDGEWKLFEYDYKNTRLISRVERLKLKNGEHTIVAVVEDECGNESRFEWKFSTSGR